VSTKKQLIIIAVAALMLSVSLLGSVGLVAAITPTTITLTTNTTTPAANQSFTLSGTLTANNTPLPGKLITLGSDGPLRHLERGSPPPPPTPTAPTPSPAANPPRASTTTRHSSPATPPTPSS
jgi:hypothetical protein